MLRWLRPQTILFIVALLAVGWLFVSFVPLQVYKVSNSCQNIPGESVASISQTKYHLLRGQLSAFRDAKQAEDASCQSAQLKLYL